MIEDVDDFVEDFFIDWIDLEDVWLLWVVY